jgi:hypothetical protein
MKNLIRKIPAPILTFFLGIIFLATWPFIFIGQAIYSLFSDKYEDSKKIKILKEIAEILIIAFTILIFYWIFG